jgi:hypothetical protein
MSIKVINSDSTKPTLISSQQFDEYTLYNRPGYADQLYLKINGTLYYAKFGKLYTSYIDSLAKEFTKAPADTQLIIQND